MTNISHRSRIDLIMNLLRVKYQLKFQLKYQVKYRSKQQVKYQVKYRVKYQVKYFSANLGYWLNSLNIADDT